MAVTLTANNAVAITFTMVEPNPEQSGEVEIHLLPVLGVLPIPTDLESYLGEMIDNIEGFSDCRVSNVNITYGYAVTDNALFGDSPNVQRKGVFTFNSDVPQVYPRVAVPGLDYDALAADGIHILRSGSTFSGSLAAALQGFHDKLVNGATVGAVTYPAGDYRGANIVSLKDAYQRHSRSSRG